MEGGNYGWIEILFFYGIALGIGIYQYVKTDRLLKKSRAERLKREAEEAAAREKESE